MASTSSPSIRCESERVPERPIMPHDIFEAAMKGDKDVLIRRLGLQTDEETEIKVTIEDSNSAPEHKTVQSELQSATRFVGDTVLHLLVTNGHNELALNVFKRDMSLLKAKNKMLETPLYCAAKVRNKEVIKELIRINSIVVKDALTETNENGDTAMHVAANNNHTFVVCELMMLDTEAAYKVNNKMLTPFYMAIVKKNNSTALTMLDVDHTLACTQFSDGMFPVHVAAFVGSTNLLLYFFSEYPDYAELLDTRGRNIFHIVAEQGHDYIVSEVFLMTSVEVIARMYDASDYEGNKPWNIAKLKGNRSCHRSLICLEKIIQKNKNLTPVELCRRFQKLRWKRGISNDDDDEDEDEDKNMWQKIQVTGLGSVLITTVAFAASFTVPGGYNQDNGTPVLGRRYTFWAYILANAFAFIQGFVSLFALLLNAVTDMPPKVIDFAVMFFLLAASSMVVAFGLGLYVTLSPVCLPIAILLLVITLFLGSPALLEVLLSNRSRYIKMVVRILGSRRTTVAAYMVPLVLIVVLALMSLLYASSF